MATVAQSEGLKKQARTALDEYLAEQDKDSWCQRLKYGRCQTRKCLVDKDGKLPPVPIDFDLASCPRFRLEQERALSQAQRPVSEDETAMQERGRVVAWMRHVANLPGDSDSDRNAARARKICGEIYADAIERGDHWPTPSPDNPND